MRHKTAEGVQPSSGCYKVTIGAGINLLPFRLILACDPFNAPLVPCCAAPVTTLAVHRRPARSGDSVHAAGPCA